MPRYIIKMKKGDESAYLVWSTVTDSPITKGMTLEDLQAFVEFEEGASGLARLPERMERVERFGTSALIPMSVEELMTFNRAGPNESELSYDGVWDNFVANKE
jgi:hypothetical protein